MASLYVKKSGKNGWVIQEQSYVETKSIQKTVPKLSYEALGINPGWDLEQAKEAVKRINQQNKLKRDHVSKITAIARRVTQIQDIDSAYLPEDLKTGFIEHLEQSSFGSQAHNKRLLAMFESVCKIIKTLGVDPKDFSFKSGVIYNHLISKHYSRDYCKKLIRMFNLWGKYVCKQRQVPYSPIEVASRQISSKIDDAYDDTPRRGRRVSAILTPNHLDILKAAGYPELYLNWLTLSVWFGLRPKEVDSLHDNKKYKTCIENGVEILYVYQSKLTQIPKEQRWKGIPCLYPQQVQSLAIAQRRAFKRPSLEGMRSILKDYKIDLYGGRKGFIDLMLDRKQNLEDISAWMGHQDIAITWRKYRNRKRVTWSKTG